MPTVRFTLSYKAPSPEGNIYVFGALSDWQFDPTNLMVYYFDKKLTNAKYF